MLTVIIDGHIHDRASVHAWEDRRMTKVRRTLGLPATAAPREQQRAELLERKVALGHHGLRRLIGRRLWWSEKVTRFSVAVSRGKRRSASARSKSPPDPPSNSPAGSRTATR